MAPKTIVLLNKQYSGESIVDLERDISEMRDSNGCHLPIPQDEYGIEKGRFIVSITWEAIDHMNHIRFLRTLDFLKTCIELSDLHPTEEEIVEAARFLNVEDHLPEAQKVIEFCERVR